MQFEKPISESNQKIALIVGITGQDGFYLSEFLIVKNYIIHGILRNSSSLSNLSKKIILHYGDLTDNNSLMRIIDQIKPDEIYNLAAQTDVKMSYDLPLMTSDIDSLGTLRLLEAIRICKLENKVKFFQAGTSELFGKPNVSPQTETTRFYPRSPYGVAKLYSYWITINYREAFNIFAVNGILYNHESPRRSTNFVTRKISQGVAKISLNKQDFIELGNLDAKRDWGHAKDYVEAMWLMLQNNIPTDYVISTNETHSVRDFVECCFKEIKKEICWIGTGENEIGVEKNTGITRIKIDPNFYRPSQALDNCLVGDSTKAYNELNWKCKISFKDMVQEMVSHDIQLLEKITN